MSLLEFRAASEGFAMSRGVDMSERSTPEESVDMVNLYWRELGLAEPVKVN